ncbi:MAG: amino acid adenylation domain-containing protein, partial [bacterium]|nr:amino acid adenylation domain-containing protein [bacterium]
LWSEVLGPAPDRIGVNANFFQLGGHSLKAAGLIAAIHKDFSVEIPIAKLFEAPTIRGISQLIAKTDPGSYASIQLLEEKEYYPLSSAQKRLFVIHRLDPSTTTYNLPQTFHLKGRLDPESLEAAIKALIRRHESLRTSFEIIDGEPVQRIHDHVEFRIEFIGRGEPMCSPLHGNHSPSHGNHSPSHDNHSGNRNNPGTHGGVPLQSQRDFIRPFDLSNAPLLRIDMVEIEEDHHLLFFDMHHIISDGVSMEIFTREFMASIGDRSLPPLPLRYKDYTLWELHMQEELSRQQEFWVGEFGEFEEEVPLLDLPLDYVRPKVLSTRGKTLRFQVRGSDVEVLKTIAIKRNVTLYMVLLSLYTIFLAKISNQETIVVGTPAAGRRHADLEQVIGMFVNTLVLKNLPAGEKPFYSFLEEVKTKTLMAFSNQDYHYEELVGQVLSSRDPGRNPLFDTMFILQNMDAATFEIPGLTLEPRHHEHPTSKFDLTLVCVETDGGLSCSLEYSTALFTQETIQRFVNYLKNIISSVLRDTRQHISQIEMLTEEEKKQLILEFNDTAEDYPTDKNKTIYQLFEQTVDKYPGHSALVFKDRTLTFRHFDDRANRLAHYLIAENGVQPGDPVAVLMDRSIELIIALMAIMKTRGAYVPMDASLPSERIRVVFNDASIGTAISQQSYFAKLSALQPQCPSLQRVLCIEDLQETMDNFSPASPDTGLTASPGSGPAYIMYTSGSSGVPKGVLVEHRTIVNTIIWRRDKYEYAPGYVSLQVPPHYFDSSVTDIFCPLLGGARLVLIKDEERSDLTILRGIITRNAVTHFIVVPIFYNVMLEEIPASLKDVKMICCAGDHFPHQLIRKHFERLPHTRIFNEYGPTENSVNTTAYELKPDSTKALIGKPISNVRVYVLDKYLSLCPVGVTGELCLAGTSLARGYLNRPEITAEKFVVPSASRFLKKAPQKLLSMKRLKDETIYLTGDMGRWLADGNLEFMGRVDNQVKIRGIRIETGEVENQLLKREDVKEVVVRVRKDQRGDNNLCAWLVPGQGSLEPAELKIYLLDRLPSYMIPSYFIALEQLPLTPNGKLDTNSLPAPQPGQDEEYAPPRNEIEQKMVDIWAGVLGKDKIGIHDNFFANGGDSIKSIQIMSRMNSAGYKLEMK